MQIRVIATASAYRGALVIYKRFLEALTQNAGADEWHMFVDKLFKIYNLIRWLFGAGDIMVTVSLYDSKHDRCRF